jgi:PAS domain S-box-containing protein
MTSSNSALNSLIGTIALRIRQSLDLEEILNSIVTEVRQLLQTDRVLIYRFDRHGNGTVTVESLDEGRQSLLGQTVKASSYSRDWVEHYQQGGFQAISDIDIDRVSSVELLQKYRVKANLSVPILSRCVPSEQIENNKKTLKHRSGFDSHLSSNNPKIFLWGLLIAQECSRSRHWQTEEIEFLRQIATQVEIAIQRAELLTKNQTELAARKKAQTELAKSEARFRRLAENALDVIFRHRLLPKEETEYINPAVAEITGYSCAEFYRDSQLFNSLIYPQDLAKWQLHLQKERRKSSLIILRWLDASEKIVWIEVRTTPILDSGGNLIAIEGIARDLSKYPFLRLPRRNMSAMFSPLSRFLSFWRLPFWTGGLVTAIAAVAIESLSRAGIFIPIPFFLLLLPVLISSSLGGVKAGLASSLVWTIYLVYGTIYKSPYPKLTAGILPMSLGVGLVFVLALFLGKQKEENQQLTQALQNANDRLEKQVEQRTNALAKNNEILKQEINERKQAEIQIQQARNFLQIAIEHLPVAVFVKDGKPDSFGTFRLWNKKSENMLGLNSDRVLGKTDYDFFPKHQADWFWQTDKQVFAEGIAVEIAEESIDSHSLGKRILRTLKVPIYDENNQPEYLLGIAEDITDRKQEQAELVNKSQELAEFSSNLKHLHRLNTTNYNDFEELFDDYLDTGCQIFDCSTGIVTRIEDEICTIYAFKSNLPSLKVDLQIPLKDTYCDRAAKNRQTIVYNRVGKMKEIKNLPLYQLLKLESYIGTPILVNEVVYGTLSFSSTRARNKNFSDREQEFIELMAQSIGKYIAADRIEKERQEAERALRNAKIELEARVVARTIELSNAKENLESELAERKQAEAALTESERRWRSLLENVRTIVVGLDLEGKVEYVNKFFLELTGYTRAEVMGKDWFVNFLPQPENMKVKQAFLECLEENLHPHYQNSILTKTLEQKMIHWHNTLMHNKQGQAVGTMSIGEDVTERYAIERMKDEFISVVSHELRTPLTSIHGALNLLSSKSIAPESKQGRRVIEIAAESTERLVRLVNDILELERLESGKIRLSQGLVDTNELMLQALDQVQIVANRAGIKLEVERQNLQLFVDGDRIIQVLTNLLTNAIKFSESGSTVYLAVQRSIDNNNKSVLFSVKDRGRGIPTDKLESIFERFHQVEASDSRRQGGTGLGLTICRNIIEQHQGKIWVESTLGKGSVFYFTLPERD